MLSREKKLENALQLQKEIANHAEALRGSAKAYAEMGFYSSHTALNNAAKALELEADFTVRRIRQFG